MNAVLQAHLICGAAARGVAEEDQPQATELRRRTQDLVRMVQQTRGAAPGRRDGPPRLSPRDFWRAVRNACPAFDDLGQHCAADFFLQLRRSLARLPGGVEPSPAWAAWLAESDLPLVTYTTCHACGVSTHNMPAPGAPPRQPEPVLMATLQAGAAYEGMLEAMRSSSGPEDLADHRCVTCGERGGVRVTKCRRLPLVLVVWLKRFARTAGIGRRIEAAVRRLG